MPGSPRRLSALPLYLIGVLALVLAMGGAATAGALITSKQIKDNTVTSKDIKNGTLLLKDVKRSELTRLKGARGVNGASGANGKDGKNGTNGTNGTNGKDGASAYAPPPSGTVIKGGGMLSVAATGSMTFDSYAPLPFATATPLDDTAPNRNVYFGGADAVAFGGETDATKCPGTVAAPTALPGNLCVYVASTANTSAASGILWAGATTSTAEGAESSGIHVQVSSAAAGTTDMRYIWVYTAP